jgi:hypothetical protein
MAGQPVMQSITRKLEEEFGGEDWVYDQLASGVVVGKVAEQLGISRRYLYFWRDQRGHKERRKPLWEEAIRMAGEAHAEGVFDDLDNVPDHASSAQVSLASAKAKHRTWLAGKLDRERFGERGMELSFSIGELHLRALQSSKVEHIEEADVEILDDGDTDVEALEGDAQAPEPLALPVAPDSTDELADLL